MINPAECMKLAVKRVNEMCRTNSFLDSYYEKEDLYSEAYVSLVRASKNFDESKGFVFSTFAYKYITNALLRLANKERYFNIKYPMQNNNSLIYLDQDLKGLEYSLETSNAIADSRYGNEYINNKIILNECLSVLDEREKKAFILFYLYGYTQTDVGKELGICQSRTNQIISKAKKKMQKEIM